MNTGIIHNALTLTRTLALELEYRESSVFREIETEPEWPTRSPALRRLFEDEFTCLLKRD
jgi:hypothetical protein